jgi:hypothetical protein
MQCVIYKDDADSEERHADDQIEVDEHDIAPRCSGSLSAHCDGAREDLNERESALEE